uniref:Co-chaperone DjlA N-terminal domain-containing protein n=1 Tax=uncultured Helicobacter sp. TaxID=175537 RepID=A0A650ELI5_9HELI|nr:hypothetical protein Helico5904_1180 [uncultured Helicobacter sp.]
MEIVLLAIAGVVIYLLYNTLQEYLKNPLHQMPSFGKNNNTAEEVISFQNPYEEIAALDKAKASEFGVLSAILGKVVWSDGHICPLEHKLLDEMIVDMSAESKNPKLTPEDIQNIIMEQKDNNSMSLESLCDRYTQLTKGEYKKRLKVVEFLFALAYADGVLSEGEQECIIDVAALFEISNEDFNALYENFEKNFAQDLEVSLETAKEIFEYHQGMTLEDVKQTYDELIKKSKQNIFDSKNINKSFCESSLPKIREIEQAYKVLKEFLESQDASQPTQVQQEEKHQGDVASSQSSRGWDF